MVIYVESLFWKIHNLHSVSSTYLCCLHTNTYIRICLVFTVCDYIKKIVTFCMMLSIFFCFWGFYFVYVLRIVFILLCKYPSVMCTNRRSVCRQYNDISDTKYNLSSRQLRCFLRSANSNQLYHHHHHHLICSYTYMIHKHINEYSEQDRI